MSKSFLDYELRPGRSGIDPMGKRERLASRACKAAKEFYFPDQKNA